MSETPAGIDWEKELGPEKEFPTNYKYVIQDGNLEIAGDFVFCAVLSMLTNDEYYQKWLNDFVRGSTNSIPNEKAELSVRNRINTARDSSDTLARAVAEATKQKLSAKDAVRAGTAFRAHFEYWSPAVIPLKGGVELDPIQKYPGYLQATTQLPTVNQLMGFPQIILQRYIEGSSGIDPIDIIGRTAALSRSTLHSVIQDMFNLKAATVFLDAMDNVGRYSKFDRVRADFIRSGITQDGKYSLAETFHRFTEKEKQLVQRPSEQSFWFQLNHTIEKNGGSGQFHIDHYTTGSVWYDPETDSIQGELVPSQTDHINAYVTSVITPATTHEGLLEVRRKSQEVVKKLGFPEPSRALYW